MANIDIDKSYYQKLYYQNRYLEDLTQRNSKISDLSDEEKIKFPFIIIEYMNTSDVIFKIKSIRSLILQQMRRKQNFTVGFLSQ